MIAGAGSWVLGAGGEWEWRGSGGNSAVETVGCKSNEARQLKRVWARQEEAEEGVCLMLTRQVKVLIKMNKSEFHKS
ncbi:hypothetical protein E2C01_021580 [Portunus trituberculatus]|uniref:Uncharacterized protein n=1 Tax=Portunus trituberculatus TaxID=210409 RepID=A0A5B7E4V6_PORTR|nr:hypothetical protein [Portunus trituberculatus]